MALARTAYRPTLDIVFTRVKIQYRGTRVHGYSWLLVAISRSQLLRGRAASDTICITKFSHFANVLKQLVVATWTLYDQMIHHPSRATLGLKGLFVFNDSREFSSHREQPN
jgi:hypothetical protein